ncbi:MAG: EAL domain-containing protein [Betaproteobacteria bacterium]|nr:EAL domain-containing protein [Betaproteobacteria bacterium]
MDSSFFEHPAFPLLQQILDALPQRVYWKDIHSRYRGCNALFAASAGIADPHALVGKTDDEFSWKDQAQVHRADDCHVMATGRAKLGFEESRTMPDGTRVQLRVSKWPLRNPETQEVIGVLGLYEDITDGDLARQAQIRLARAFRLLSDCNTALVRATEEDLLLDDICRLAVEIGGYSMCWVGFAERDMAKTVRPVARFGDGDGYVDEVKITWADEPRGQGPVGTAIRQARAVVNPHCLTNLKMDPWRAAALAQGYQSSIALPLTGQQRVLGALTIYSREPYAFNPEEVALLEELANNLAYGIESLRTRFEHEEALRRLEFLAYHDPLTRLPNRLLLQDRFEQAKALSQRSRSWVAILLLDLDHFKQINEAFGHDHGDRLLVLAVERLRRSLRASDTVSRQAGDEFVVVVPEVRDVPSVSAIAQGILASFAEPFPLDGQDVNTSFTIGISLFPGDGQELDVLLKQAAAALNDAKEAGRNTYRFFSERMNVNALENMRLLGQLHEASRKREFELYYQPQIDIASGRIVGAEALLRWRHPERGIVSPAEFIPLAERSGLIIPIGEWVLNEACRQMAEWQGTCALPSMIIAVNISALQFRRGDIVETVARALDRARLAPGQLELELTESVLLHDMEAVAATVQRLKDLGVKLSIDDFGTGYSSLRYLKRLAPDKLKVDRSFVRDVVQDDDNAAIVGAIVHLGHVLQITVLAEGVETPAQLARLAAYGCDQYQGYLCARPLQAPEFIRLCKA